jgi:hypothetical protein
MILGIVIVGWIVGALSATLAVVLGDPGLLGAIGVFLSTGLVSSVAAAASYALRPEKTDAPSGTPDTAPGHWAVTGSASDLSVAAVARTADPLREPSFQRPS